MYDVIAIMTAPLSTTATMWRHNGNDIITSPADRSRNVQITSLSGDIHSHMCLL